MLQTKTAAAAAFDQPGYLTGINNAPADEEPLSNHDYSFYRVNNTKADADYYEFLVAQQKGLVRKAPMHNTPKSVMVFDENSGKHLKVLPGKGFKYYL